MIKVLMICVHNSGRSQMAEAYLQHYGGENFHVESAGFEPRSINPLVVEVMAEEGFDLSDKKPQSVFELFKAGKIFNYVVTVCSEGEDANCPIFPGLTHRLHFPFFDPAAVAGDHAEKVSSIREIRDGIKQKMEELALMLTSSRPTSLQL